jgi:hypothetical protein
VAYVRRTDKLIDGIKQKIARMRQKAEEMHASERIEPGTPIHDEVRKAIEAAAWELKPELRDAMPQEWCYTSDHCRVVFFDQHNDRIMASSISMRNDDRLVFPCKPSSYYDDVSVYFRHQSTALRQWLAEEDKRKRQRDELRQQYHDVERQIVAFMSTKTSLNAALSEMPELELYVPQEFMDKYHEVKEARVNKTAPVETEVFVDRDQLAALGVAHRITATAAE